LSLLNKAVMAPAWTVVLIDEGPALGARRWRRGYTQPRYLKSWDQLEWLNTFPRGSILYEWDGRQWLHPPYLAISTGPL
jgi:hypothetical protein